MMPLVARSQPIDGVRRGFDETGAPKKKIAAWELSNFEGRLAEISAHRASSALTLTFRLVLEAQRRGDPVAWISRPESVFFPPDVAALAVDLDALVVVWADQARQAARAADQLLRSGAFGLVVLDLGREAHIPPAAQSRLMGLAGKHRSAVVCLTEKEEQRPSVGSLISIRAEARRSHDSDGRRFRCEARILKDKRSGPGWSHVEFFHGPDGLH